MENLREKRSVFAVVMAGLGTDSPPHSYAFYEKLVDTIG